MKGKQAIYTKIAFIYTKIKNIYMYLVLFVVLLDFNKDLLY